MTEEMEKIDYDIAIIGCGAYVLSLVILHFLAESRRYTWVAVFRFCLV